MIATRQASVSIQIAGAVDKTKHYSVSRSVIKEIDRGACARLKEKGEGRDQFRARPIWIGYWRERSAHQQQQQQQQLQCAKIRVQSSK